MAITSATPLDRIGVGIDTARYGHRVSFLRPDRQPVAKPLTVLENHAGYLALQQRLEQLHEQHPHAHFHVRVDAAGQYAANLEHFLRSLRLPLTISIGEPKRNKDHQKAHFPKRTTDDTESQAMARYAVVELPHASLPIPPQLALLREVTARLHAQVKQTTQAVNRLHNLMARVFPELATLADDFGARWVLYLLDHYPTAPRIANGECRSLEQVPYLPKEQVEALHQAAKTSVGTLRGAVAETLVREQVTQVRHSLTHEAKLRRLLEQAFAELPAGGHQQVRTISGIGLATAAVLVAKIVDIDALRQPGTPGRLFRCFPGRGQLGRRAGRSAARPGHAAHVAQGQRPRPRLSVERDPLRHAAQPSRERSVPALRGKGKRGDVAIGHCMRKLLHLVFAVWKTNRPFDPNHFPWAPAAPTPAAGELRRVLPGANRRGPRSGRGPHAGTACRASGHHGHCQRSRRCSACPRGYGNAGGTPPRRRVDFAFLREQIAMETVLRQSGVVPRLARARPAIAWHVPAAHAYPGQAVYVLGTPRQECVPVFSRRVRGAGECPRSVGRVAQVAAVRGRPAPRGNLPSAWNREEEPV